MSSTSNATRQLAEHAQYDPTGQPSPQATSEKAGQNFENNVLRSDSEDTPQKTYLAGIRFWLVFTA
jgi:hypothetical protein